MADPIKDIRGMQPALEEKLVAAGIRNTQQLLEQARTVKQRAELAHKVGTTPAVLKELVNRADLMRLKGVGGDFSNLLEEAGINSCKELQHRTPAHLHEKLVEIHSSQKIGHRAPTLAQVTEWIEESKTLVASSPE